MHEIGPQRINRMSMPSSLASSAARLSHHFMKLLLLGADGQLGAQLRAALAPLGEVTALGRGCDLSQLDAIVSAARASKWHAIVNAAAYTAVDRAESDRER